MCFVSFIGAPDINKRYGCQANLFFNAWSIGVIKRKIVSYLRRYVIVTYIVNGKIYVSHHSHAINGFTAYSERNGLLTHR